MRSVFSVDESVGETVRLCEMLMSCASVQVSDFRTHPQQPVLQNEPTIIQVIEGDGMPSQVCLQCVHYINRAFSFKQLCERSDTTLRQLLATSVDSTFLELKPVSPHEFIVSDVEISQHIGNGVQKTEMVSLAKEERLMKVDEGDGVDGFFSECGRGGWKWSQ